MTARTDPHRPGAIVPADYQPVLYYALGTHCDGWPVPPLNVNCEVEKRTAPADGPNGAHAPDGKCCIIGLLHVARVPFAAHGSTGKCTVCGAAFIEGEVWRHEPTGEHIHVGHICAAKYELYADWSKEELARERQRDNARHAALRSKKALWIEAYLDEPENEGLRAALAVGHPIIADIAARLKQYGEPLSSKQVALVLKLANEVLHPEAKTVEARVDAPTGKQTFRGRVVSVKSHESAFGVQLKMTVKVTTPEGVWLAWGTAPAALLDATVNHHGALRGDKGGPGTEVEITATLQAGREPSFAIMKRPRGKVIALACGAACAYCAEQARLADASRYGGV